MRKEEKTVDCLSYDMIYIDTCSAMHYAFRVFVNNNAATLYNSHRKIIVIAEVWRELVRGYNSSETDKRNAAEQAISIISSHRNVFDIEDENISQDELEQAFADKVLLSRLILHRTDERILLITNDKNLSRDALELNKQKSCYGNSIDTCYISECGELEPGLGFRLRQRTYDNSAVYKLLPRQITRAKPRIIVGGYRTQVEGKKEIINENSMRKLEVVRTNNSSSATQGLSDHAYASDKPLILMCGVAIGLIGHIIYDHIME